MASVTFDKASRIYPGTTTPAVDALDLSIDDGEFLVLVGPSGCGKSTSLRMLAGLEDINDGRILIGDRDVTDVAPKDRDIAMVFQNYALYPHMTVAENMGFALKIAGVSKEDRATRVQEAAKLLDLEPYLDRKPKALSGGQRQRLALARAIAADPEVLVLDDPLSALDVATEARVESALRKVLATTTALVVAHRPSTVMLADRVALLHEGRIGAVGTHSELLETSAAYRSVISSLADTDQSPRADRAVTDSTIELEIIESAGLDDDARLVHREDGDNT